MPVTKIPWKKRARMQELFVIEKISRNKNKGGEN